MTTLIVPTVTDELIVELEAAANAATPGPWGYNGSCVCPSRTEDGTTYVELWKSIADCYQTENARFIAKANPSAILALLAERADLKPQLAAASVDAERLNSGCIVTSERDEFGEEYKCERRGLDLRAMIDAAIEARRRDDE